MLTAFSLLLICAMICFLLEAFHVTSTKKNGESLVLFWPLGWAFVIAAFVFGNHLIHL